MTIFSASISKLILCASLAIIFLSDVGAAEELALKIGDAKNWHFVASTWKDNDSGEIIGSGSGDGDGLQGLSLAFWKPYIYTDLEAEFTVCLPTNTSDTGFIVRAQDPTHYYLIHFPQCGQSYRAQNFWAALSIADGSGYLRTLKLNLVRRVASNPMGMKHHAKVKVAGDRIQVWLNGHPAIDYKDGTYRSGRIGLAGFAKWSHGNVIVRGTKAASDQWNSLPQIRNWFLPFSGTDFGKKQTDPCLTFSPKGDILCAFVKNDGKIFIARSKDKGRSWSVDGYSKNLHDCLPSGSTGIHLLRDGRLISVFVKSEGGCWTESKDDGVTWENPTPIQTDGWPDGTITGWMTELKDGTLVRFGTGKRPGFMQSDKPVTMWGGASGYSTSTRSTDGGKTWSVPVCLDTSRPDMGNLDLTEPVGFETTDGRIMALIRPVYSPWMWETWSSDKAQSWGPCVFGPFPGWNPSVPVRTASGAVVFSTRFPGLAVHITRDDGMIWDDNGGGTYIDMSMNAIGSMIEVEPNLILHLYEDNSGSTIRAQYFRITPKGIEPAREMLPQTVN